MSTASLRAARVRKFILRGLVIALLLSADLVFAQNDARTLKGAAIADGVKLPLSFEPCSDANCGRDQGPGHFISPGPGHKVLVSSTQVLFSLQSPKQFAQASVHFAGHITKTTNRGLARSKHPVLDASTALLRMKLVGANPKTKANALEELPGKSNYFIGRDTRKWRTNVPTYAKVRYEDVYPGIDLVYYGTQRQLEFDLVLAPGADPAEIKLAFEGADRLHVVAEGDLELRVEGVKTRLRKPRIYQLAHGQRQQVAARYVLHEDRTVTFELADYDASKPLIIDPVLVYSTYLGGSSEDHPAAMALDSAGNLYVAGSTRGGFPTTPQAFQESFGGGNYNYLGSPPFDAFVLKLNPMGSELIYSTYIGGSVIDAAQKIVVDRAGNAYVAGFTDSADFPTTAGAFRNQFIGPYGQCWTVDNPCRNGFVAKLDARGSALVFSTYIAGTYANDLVNGLALDSSANVYITGSTGSPDFPTTPGAYRTTFDGDIHVWPPVSDYFLAKLNALGSELIYSTYLGSSTVSRDVAVDGSGNAYVLGRAVTKFNSEGSAAIYTTAIPEWGSSLALDSAGNAYVVGSVPGSPTVSDYVFVNKLDARGALAYSKTLGGNSSDYGVAIALDPSGNVYITGTTWSTDFPTTPDAVQPSCSAGPSCVDAFLAVLDPSGSTITYSTYLGGVGDDRGSAIAVDDSGSAYVAGWTSSINFPLANPLQPALGGGTDLFVTKIAIRPFLAVAIDIKPGDPNNVINLGSAGTVPVAVLGSATFDPANVDPATVTLAGAPVATRRGGVPMTSVADVNHDGYTDLLLRFRTRALHLSPSDTEAVLRGETFSGQQIRGADAVRVVPPQRRGRSAREDAPDRRH